jgi:hypothetical protein
VTDLFAFLGAVAGGDDNARRVLADWLEDRDDERGPVVRVAECGVVGRLFPAEMMDLYEREGDVVGWLRYARVLYHRKPRPTEFVVSWKFYGLLVGRLYEMSDVLGNDLIGGESTMMVMRVPVAIRETEPVGA